MHFPTKKMGVIFGVAKKDTTGGGGPEGVAFFGRNFSRLSFLNTSLRINQSEAYPPTKGRYKAQIKTIQQLWERKNSDHVYDLGEGKTKGDRERGVVLENRPHLLLLLLLFDMVNIRLLELFVYWIIEVICIATYYHWAHEDGSDRARKKTINVNLLCK